MNHCICFISTFMEGNMKKSLGFFMAALFVVMVLSVSAGTGAPEAGAKKKVAVKKITVSAPSGKTVYVAKGKKVKLTPVVKVKPDKKAYKKVKYTSKNRKVATVSASGVVKGKKAGSTKVIVQSKKNKKKKASIRVIVKKAAIKKIGLPASLTLTPGKTHKLNAAITPKKNVSRILTWTSSNPNTAVVKGGTVTAKQAGTSVITAKATDGSGKKATCKVTVTVPNVVSASRTGIKSIETLDSGTLGITLSRAQVLTAAGIKVQCRSTANGAYQTAAVDSVFSNDHVTYVVAIKAGTYLKDNDYVKVTIPSLPGVKTKEVIARFTKPVSPPVTYVSGSVGEKLDKTLYFNDYTTGKLVSVSVSGLPSGFHYAAGSTAVKISGKAKAVIGGATATVTVTDETGKKRSQIVKFYIGDATHLIAVKEPFKVLAAIRETDKNGSESYQCGYFSRDIYTQIAGGSSRKVTDASVVEGSLPKGVELKCPYSSYTISGHIEKTGTYRFKVRITMEDGLTAVIPIEITAVEPVKVSGTMKDATGKPVSGISIRFESLEEEYEYGNYFYYDNIGDDGKYELYVMKNLTYDITCEKTSLGRRKFTSSQTWNVGIPLYRVDFSLDAAAKQWVPASEGAVENRYSYFSTYLSLESNDLFAEKVYCYGKYAYVKPGTYEASGKMEVYYNVYNEGVYSSKDKAICYARGSFTVKDKNIQNVTLSLSDVPLN